MMEVAVAAGTVSRAKLQSNCHHQHPTFYRSDALPVAQPTVSKLWREYRAIVKSAFRFFLMPLLLWCCWLGHRRGICHAENLPPAIIRVLCWLSRTRSDL